MYSWLKQLWSCKADKGELPERDAIRLARKLDPFVTEQYAKRRVAVSLKVACHYFMLSLSLSLSLDVQYAHQHQVESSHGLSLEFNGFILMYNLLEDITESRVCNTN